MEQLLKVEDIDVAMLSVFFNFLVKLSDNISVVSGSIGSLLATGVDNDQTMKVYGSGGADPEGNQSGDLYVTIKV